MRSFIEKKHIFSLRYFVLSVFIFLSILNIKVIITDSNYDLNSIKFRSGNDLFAQPAGLICNTRFEVRETSGLGWLVGAYEYTCVTIITCNNPEFNKNYYGQSASTPTDIANLRSWCK